MPVRLQGREHFSSPDLNLNNVNLKPRHTLFMVEDPSLLSASKTKASSRSRVVTRPRTCLTCPRPFSAIDRFFLFTTAWAKDEPPSPTDSHHPPSSPGGSRGQSEARRSEVPSHDDSSTGPSGEVEHRWFPFTRRRPTIAPEGSASASRVEEKPVTVTTSPSGLPDGGVCSPIPVAKSPEQSRSRTRDWGLRIAMPSPPATPHAPTRSRTPGWDSPWAARPLESLSHRNIYEQLQNGGSIEEQQPDSSINDESWWPRARKRARAYLLTNTYVPLVKCILR
jgi:hypothetical protein